MSLLSQFFLLSYRKYHFHYVSPRTIIKFHWNSCWRNHHLERHGSNVLFISWWWWYWKMRNTLMRMSSIRFPASKSINKLLLDIPKPGKITQDKLYAISHDAKRKDITESKQTQRQQKNNVDSNRFECVHNRKCIGTIRHMNAHIRCASEEILCVDGADRIDDMDNSRRIFHESWMKNVCIIVPVQRSAIFHSPCPYSQSVQSRIRLEHTQSVVCRYNTHWVSARLDQNQNDQIHFELVCNGRTYESDASICVRIFSQRKTRSWLLGTRNIQRQHFE